MNAFWITFITLAFVQLINSYFIDINGNTIERIIPTNVNNGNKADAEPSDNSNIVFINNRVRTITTNDKGEKVIYERPIRDEDRLKLQKATDDANKRVTEIRNNNSNWVGNTNGHPIAAEEGKSNHGVTGNRVNMTPDNSNVVIVNNNMRTIITNKNGQRIIYERPISEEDKILVQKRTSEINTRIAEMRAKIFEHFENIRRKYFM
ncbi:hypothetical protein ACFFRR_003600 [Megaselia abdita]